MTGGVELRLANLAERTVEGIVVPYGETSYMTPDPKGERFRPGSLTATVKQRGERIKLFRVHDHKVAVGRPISWEPAHGGGCWAQFRIANTKAGDEVLTEVREGMLDAFSVGFRPVRETRGADGAREIVEAELHEVSLCPIGAYDGARVLTTRSPSTLGGLEWTTFDRRPPGIGPRHRQASGSGTYERERRRHELAAERRAHPDTGVHGCVVPYNRPLPGGRGDWLWFDGDTRWQHKLVVPLELEHGGSFLGMATPISERSGLIVDGTVYNGFAKRIGARRQLSVKLDDLDLAPRPDGTLHVRSARLVEVSLVTTAMWRPLTDAVIWQRPAA